MSVRMVLVGPPGAGKGTQAVRLSEHLGVPTISTGDMFRANISGGTELGQKVVGYTSKGLLVPDELTDAIVADRLSQPDAANGFILDGYPRNPAQVAALDRFLADRDERLDMVAEIAVDSEIVIERLTSRAQIEGREDDVEDVIRERLRVYAEQTAPLAELYVERGLLAQVDGVGEVDEITERLIAAVGSFVDH